MRSFDWGGTPLGDTAGWPQSLQSALSICLNSPIVSALYWGPEFRVLYNDAYAPALGSRHPDALGRPLAEVWPEIFDVLEPQLRQVVSSGEGFSAARQPLKMFRHGYAEDTVWFYVFAPVRGEGGEIAGVFVSATEMTSQIAAENALREANTLLAESVAAAAEERDQQLQDAKDFSRLALSAVGGVGVWTYEVERDLFHYDAAIADLYGLDPALGTEGVSRADFLVNVLPEDRMALAQTMDGGLVNAGDLELEYRTRDAKGAVRWVLSRGHTYFDGDGKPARRTGVGVELTRQRELEAQVRQSQKMEAVGQLTGGVAHDFNNLLTVIRSSVDFLLRPDLTPARRARYTAAIAETVERAAKLTSQLLAFARRQSLNPEVFDVGDKVTAAAELIRSLVGGRILIELDAPPGLAYVRADVGQFETALVNLAVNARDAMQGEGRLTIAISTEDSLPAIRTHAAKTGPYVAITVHDRGCGIAPEQLEAIFEPFYTTKEVGKGTGLGLSQVFGFVKQSNGEVVVESIVGSGSTFTLYLPRVEAGSLKAPGPKVVLVDAEVDGVCVLVVEDNETVGQFTTELLHDLGYRTRWAKSAAEALDDLGPDAGGFDLVFSDVVMPGMNGVEFARTIKRRFPSLPIVLTSGYSEVLATEGHAGFQLIQKPYSVEALSRILQSALMTPGMNSDPAGG